MRVLGSFALATVAAVAGAFIWEFIARPALTQLAPNVHPLTLR